MTPIIVVLETELGFVEINIFSERAPISSAAFLSYIDGGYFKKKGGFYRVVNNRNDYRLPPIEIIGGGIVNYSDVKPMLPVSHESTKMTGLFHKNGSVSLGREALGTANGGDFFICIGDQPALDYGGMRNPDGQGFAVFGQVIKGMDLVHNIKNMTSDAPVQSPYDKYFLGQVLDHPIRIIQAYRKSIDIAMGPN